MVMADDDHHFSSLGLIREMRINNGAESLSVYDKRKWHGRSIWRHFVGLIFHNKSSS